MSRTRIILAAGAALLLGMASLAPVAEARRGGPGGGPHGGISRGGSCAHALQQWRATGTSHWRKRYHACARGE
jgi:hypothetical protein